MDVPQLPQMNNHDTTPLLDDICEPTIPENKGRAEEPKEDISAPATATAIASAYAVTDELL